MHAGPDCRPPRASCGMHARSQGGRTGHCRRQASTLDVRPGCFGDWSGPPAPTWHTASGDRLAVTMRDRPRRRACTARTSGAGPARAGGMRQVRIELTTLGLWDLRAASCATATLEQWRNSRVGGTNVSHCQAAGARDRTRDRTLRYRASREHFTNYTTPQSAIIGLMNMVCVH